MVYGGGGAAVAAAHAAMVQATKASGVIVKVEPDAFLKIVGKNREALVVIAPGGFLTKNYQYLTSYKGLAFFTKSQSELMLPSGAEVVSAQQIWIPG